MITLHKQGHRIYFEGDTEAIEPILREIGAKHAGEKWWVGVAMEEDAKLIANPPEAPSVLHARDKWDTVRYRRKTYRVLDFSSAVYWLQSLDGKAEFFVPARKVRNSRAEQDPPKYCAECGNHGGLMFRHNGAWTHRYCIEDKELNSGR